MKEEALRVLNVFGINIDMNKPVRHLSIAQMQLIELGKAITKKSEVLILDEPTSSLTATESEKLFEIVEKLKQDGKTIIFISHRLAEMFQISDRVTVLRDGKYIGTYPCCDLDEERIVKLIAGEKLFEEIYSTSLNRKREQTCETVVLEAIGLNRGKLVKEVDLKLHEGEILGIYGLQGSGRTELVETLFGVHPSENGEIRIKGKPVSIRNPRSAIKMGLALITEDRKNRGIFSRMDIRDNIAVIHRKKITTCGFVLNRKKENKMCDRYTHDLSVKMADLRQNIQSLSGGNQQKVIIARILSTTPQIILADEPTRGVDVGAKAEIFAILRSLKEQKKSIIVISSELKEIVKECDRVLVMRNGSIVGEVCGHEIEEERILDYCFNG